MGKEQQKRKKQGVDYTGTKSSVGKESSRPGIKSKA